MEHSQNDGGQDTIYVVAKVECSTSQATTTSAFVSVLIKTSASEIGKTFNSQRMQL